LSEQVSKRSRSTFCFDSVEKSYKTTATILQTSELGSSKFVSNGLIAKTSTFVTGQKDADTKLLLSASEIGGGYEKSDNGKTSSSKPFANQCIETSSSTSE
jgi:hypothetical protein